jgi:gamma-glutamyltranspeptidase/glutathione hydrolase
MFKTCFSLVLLSSRSLFSWQGISDQRERTNFFRAVACIGCGPAALVLLLLSLGGTILQAADRSTAGYDRPYGDPKQSRSAVLATRGMVATSHPLAAQAGLDVLQAGGNAADAAIAVNAMLGFVEPMNCGPGGDLFAIYWDNKTQKLYGLNASGRSPYGISCELFEQRNLEQIPIHGILSWSVPGCVSGWDELNRRFGSRPLGELLQPAIRTAEEGFAVPQIIAGYWRNAAKGLSRDPDAAATYLVDGRAPRCGEVFKNPRLAATYRSIAEGGAEAFYRGELARKIVDYSQAHGGLFAMKDLADHQAEWVEPVSTDYRGHRVWELPPNGQGIAALEMLNLLEPYDLRAMGPGSADYLHLFIEAKKLAFADRASFYADPAFGDLPTAELISKQYARRQGKRIDPNKAAVDVPAGDPKLSAGDTVYLTVVDKDRNCCSMIQSIYYHFGSGIVPGDVGFAMQNRGALFTLEEGHLNRLEPHKRPFHTIIPAMVTREGRPWFCFGVMGGDMQPQGHVQVLVNLIDFGMNVQAAGDAARVRHSGSATPRGDKADGSGTVSVESGISDETVTELRRRGHQVKRGASVGGYQGILIDWEQGVLHGATESRKDGAAVGW